jgi:hypothetical protein
MLQNHAQQYIMIFFHALCTKLTPSTIETNKVMHMKTHVNYKNPSSKQKTITCFFCVF